MEMMLTPKRKCQLRKRRKAKPLTPEQKRRAAALYRQGAYDVNIATACQCSKAAVMAWRQDTGRESNYLIHQRKLAEEARDIPVDKILEELSPQEKPKEASPKPKGRMPKMDTQEEIDGCLQCTRASCVDCLTSTKATRKSKNSIPVGFEAKVLEGNPLSVLSELYGVSENTISRWKKALGIAGTYRRRT